MNKELLRPFDLEAAKAGDLVTVLTNTDWTLKYVAGPDDCDCMVFISQPAIYSQFVLHTSAKLRMAPLAWLEGKPVYKGDVVYYKQEHYQFTEPRIVLEQAKWGNPGNLAFEGDDYPWARLYTLTWTKPVAKVKKEGWVNLYPATKCAAYSTDVHFTKKEADYNADKHRVACVRIEWEEEA